MTVLATRAPLQLLPNHYDPVMSEPRPGARRSSARLRDKDDGAPVNGAGAADKGAKRADGAAPRSGRAANGAGAAGGAGRGKRKLEYDEEDDGFAFTRTRSKRPKAAAEPAEPAILEDPKPPTAKRTRKKTTDATSIAPEPATETAPKRRSTRNSGESIEPEPTQIVVPKKRAKQATSRPKQKAQKPNPDQAEGETDQVGATGEASQTPVATEVAKEPTKIALPFADTPIIRRNKEMRNASDSSSRRSSLSMRGRRASSLIDSGTSNALPHNEVASSEFFKHIETGLPEPRRMKQLLIWCGTRALDDKPSSKKRDKDDPAIRLAAREIQQQLLKDFSTNSELSDWFSREDTNAPKTLQPNPKNVANLAKIDELQAQLQRLVLERKRWEALLRPSPSSYTLPTPSDAPTSMSLTTLPPDTAQHLSPAEAATLASLLPASSTTQAPITSSEPTADPPPARAAAATRPTPPDPDPLDAAATRDRLRRAAAELEFATDRLAQGAHAVGRHVAAADRTAAAALRVCAQRLEAWDRRAEARAAASAGAAGDAGAGAGARVGTRDVLRGLSRVIGR